MLWKTSWLGQEPAETRCCLGPAMEPPLREALRSPCVGKEKGHMSGFLLGVEGQEWRLCLPVSELGRK